MKTLVKNLITDSINENTACGGIWAHRAQVHKDVAVSLGKTFKGCGGTFNAVIREMLESGELLERKRSGLSYYKFS